MRGATAAVGPRRWLALSEASRILGVDGSTLRAWADAGRVRAFRTPGGHRRFAREDLQSLLRPGGAKRPLQVARQVDRQGRVLARARTDREAAWYAALDDAALTSVRQTCRSLMQALSGYLAGGARRRLHMRVGEAAGRRLGTVLAGQGLTSAQAAEAFLHFRGAVSEAVTTRLSLPPEQQLRTLRQIDAFLSRVMVRMLETFGRPRR